MCVAYSASLSLSFTEKVLFILLGVYNVVHNVSIYKVYFLFGGEQPWGRSAFAKKAFKVEA